MRFSFILSLALICPAAFPATGVAADVEKKPDPAAPTTLDISRGSDGLPVVTPDSDPAAISAAIQARLDYLHERHLHGRVFIPAGRWRVNRPVFMNGDGMEVVGAGVGRTVVEAADGYGAMPMINAGARTEADMRPLQAANRVRLTDPAGRVVDDSVTGERYGLRTYTEYPADHFPAQGHQAVTAKGAKKWAKGTAYQPNDVIDLAPAGAVGPVHAVCVAAHTAADANQPFKGAEWKSFWVVKVPAHVQFFADPLAAGAFDPAAKRACNWAGMDRFTLDIAYTQNVEPKVYGNGRMICGVFGGDPSRPERRAWVLTHQPNGDVTFNLSLADDARANEADGVHGANGAANGAANAVGVSVRVARGCTTAGTYRLAVQADLASGSVRAWLRKPGEAEFAATCDDRKAVPAGSHFRELEFGYFLVAGGDGSPSASNGRQTPPTDITLCGLHTSAALRYADADALHRRESDGPVDDQFRCFTNDAGTLAFLPLEDHPAESEMKTAGLLVTVQHGPTAGDAGQKGYGYLKAPMGIYGIGGPRVSDLTLRPGPVWGAGIVNWHTLNAQYSNLNVRGGYWAIGDLFYGAQYPFYVRDCVLSGSDAAFAGSSNIIYLNGVTIDPVGRCGVLLAGSNAQLDGVTFRDPVSHQSEYYFRHVASVDYGGMNLLTNVPRRSGRREPLPVTGRLLAAEHRRLAHEPGPAGLRRRQHGPGRGSDRPSLLLRPLFRACWPTTAPTAAARSRRGSAPTRPGGAAG